MIKADEKYIGDDHYRHPFFIDSGVMGQSWFKTKIKELSTPNAFASIGQILFEHSIIFLTILANVLYPNPWLYVPSVMIIGSRFHALFIVMHDGAHYKVSKIRWLNEAITQILICIPLFANLRDWRRAHFAHHRDPNSNQDPDLVIRFGNPEYVLPKKVKDFLKLLMSHMFGLKMVKTFFSPYMKIKDKIFYFGTSFMSPVMAAPPIDKSHIAYYNTKEKVIIVSTYILALTIIFYLGIFKMFFLFWVLPMILWTHFISKLRSYSEHSGLDNSSLYQKSRTLYTTILDKTILGYAWNVGLHLDHHLFPGVPSYRLKKLHNTIKNLSPYREHAHITKHGIFGVIKECTI